MNDVPVLLTYDIHINSPHPVAAVERYLYNTLAEHNRLGVKASFLFPAEAARMLKPVVHALLKEGHEVGCHGLTHGRAETYNSLPLSVQEENLRQATWEIEDIVQQPVTFFRAPVFKISGATIIVLEKLGYKADLSMNSQRLGLLSSDVWNVTWMIAPRRPYHPDTRYPWRRGRSKLWEIPLSCFVLPLMINTMQVFGPSFMKGFFRGFYLESCCLEKPIVYMVHPEDLCAAREPLNRRPFRWGDLIPTKVDGFPFKYSFYETDPVKIARWSRDLMEYIRSFVRVKFFTVPEYVTALEQGLLVHKAP